MQRSAAPWVCWPEPLTDRWRNWQRWQLGVHNPTCELAKGGGQDPLLPWGEGANRRREALGLTCSRMRCRVGGQRIGSTQRTKYFTVITGHVTTHNSVFGLSLFFTSPNGNCTGINLAPCFLEAPFPLLPAIGPCVPTKKALMSAL